jgi:hypothetical protein
VNTAKFKTREFPAMRLALIRVAERAITWQRAAYRAERLSERYFNKLFTMVPAIKAAKPVISDYQI